MFLLFCSFNSFPLKYSDHSQVGSSSSGFTLHKSSKLKVNAVFTQCDNSGAGCVRQDTLALLDLLRICSFRSIPFSSLDSLSSVIVSGICATDELLLWFLCSQLCCHSACRFAFFNPVLIPSPGSSVCVGTISALLLFWGWVSASYH